MRAEYTKDLMMEDINKTYFTECHDVSDDRLLDSLFNS